MTTEDRPHDPAPEYEIRVAGHLAPRWSAWFDGMTVTTGADGTTVLRGPVIDQAALHGLLQKLRDVGIPLVSLRQVTANPSGESPAHPADPAHPIRPSHPISPAHPTDKEH